MVSGPINVFCYGQNNKWPYFTLEGALSQDSTFETTLKTSTNYQSTDNKNEGFHLGYSVNAGEIYYLTAKNTGSQTASKSYIFVGGSLLPKVAEGSDSFIGTYTRSKSAPKSKTASLTSSSRR